MAAIATHPHTTNEGRRIARFLVVGASGTAVDFVLLLLLKSLGWPTLIANTVSFSAGIINNFCWNTRWTFPDAQRHGWQHQFPRFVIVSVGGLILNTCIVLLLEVPMSTLILVTDAEYLPAKIVATGASVLWNYSINRYWTFGLRWREEKGYRAGA